MAAPEVANQLLAQLSCFRDSIVFADFTIICRGKTWKVHRLVLGIHSPVLLRECNGSARWAIDRRLDLSSQDPAVVECLVEYVYTLDYTRENGAPKQDIQLAVLADHYKIFGLKDKAVNNALAFVRYWGMCFVSSSFDQVVELIRAAYAAPWVTAEVRETAVKKLVELGIMADREYVNKLRRAMVDYPEFAVDLVTTVAGQARTGVLETPSSTHDSVVCFSSVPTPKAGRFGISA